MADPITLGTAALAGGHAVSAIGSLVGGDMAASGMEQAGELRAQGLEGQAAESRAAGQREMFEQQRKARYALSTLRARSAMSGSGSDTDVIRLGGDIAARGEYLALAELYTGENRARGLLDEADAARWSGKAGAEATRVNSYFSAAGSILKGVGAATGGRPTGGSTLPSDPLDIRPPGYR